MVDLLTLGGILKVAPVVFSGVSSSIAVVNFLRQFRRVTFYKSTREAINRRAEYRVKEPPDADKLIGLLDYSSHLVQPLRSKIISRFAASICVIIASYAAVAVDFPGQITDVVPDVEGIDLALFAIQLLAAFLPSSHFLLSKDDRGFITNLSILHCWFYDTYVQDGIIQFNLELADSGAIRSVASQLGQSMDRETDRVTAAVRKVLADERDKPKVAAATNGSPSLNDGSDSPTPA